MSDARLELRDAFEQPEIRIVAGFRCEILRGAQGRDTASLRCVIEVVSAGVRQLAVLLLDERALRREAVERRE